MPQALLLSRLPEPQQAMFAGLSFTRDEFVLYGGTAVASQVGHRESHDFDFFSSLPLNAPGKRSLTAELPGGTPHVTEDSADTLSLEVAVEATTVRLSFFGGIRLPRLALPIAAPTGSRVASALDLAGFELAMAGYRHEENDVADLAALLESELTLPQAAGAMRRIYGEQASLEAAVAALAWATGRTPSPQRALTAGRKRLIEQTVAGWRGETADIPAENADLSAPGFLGAVTR